MTWKPKGLQNGCRPPDCLSIALHSQRGQQNSTSRLSQNIYLLTPWSRVLLETLTGLRLDKKFPAFHGTRTFLTAWCEYFVRRCVFTVWSCWHLPQHHKLEDHPLPVVRDCLFNILAATLHIGDRPPQPQSAPCRNDRDPLIKYPNFHSVKQLSTIIAANLLQKN